MSSHQGQEQDPGAGLQLYRGGASLPCQPPWGASPPGLTLREGGRQGSFSGTAMMEVLAATEPGTHGRQRKDGQGDARAHVERAGRRPLAAGGWGRARGREPAHSHRDLSWPGTGQQVTPGAPSTHSSTPRSSGTEVPRNPQAVQGPSGAGASRAWGSGPLVDGTRAGPAQHRLFLMPRGPGLEFNPHPGAGPDPAQPSQPGGAARPLCGPLRPSVSFSPSTCQRRAPSPRPGCSSGRQKLSGGPTGLRVAPGSPSGQAKLDGGRRGWLSCLSFTCAR